MRKPAAKEIMTNRDDRSVSLYLNELTSIKLIDPQKESEIAKLSRSGDPNAINALVSANLRFVVSRQLKNLTNSCPLKPKGSKMSSSHQTMPKLQLKALKKVS